MKTIPVHPNPQFVPKALYLLALVIAETTSVNSSFGHSIVTSSMYRFVVRNEHSHKFLDSSQKIWMLTRWVILYNSQSKRAPGRGRGKEPQSHRSRKNARNQKCLPSTRHQQPRKLSLGETRGPCSRHEICLGSWEGTSSCQTTKGTCHKDGITRTSSMHMVREWNACPNNDVRRTLSKMIWMSEVWWEREHPCQHQCFECKMQFCVPTSDELCFVYIFLITGKLCNCYQDGTVLFSAQGSINR